uniref:Pentatricopeptide repeat-containing protein n=1 Tax=Arundo donax TaxID=35708 RepID=A0A0A9FWE8_ARUDO
MFREDCPLDETTVSILIDSLCRNGLVDLATAVFEQMSKYGCTPNSMICNSLVNSFSEQGRGDETLKLLNSMS